MIVEFVPEARADAHGIVAWYADKDRPDLAERFQRELERTLNGILDLPYRWPPALLGTRRALLKKMPYVLVYRVEAERIVVHAVAHQHQDPAAWQNRLR